MNAAAIVYTSQTGFTARYAALLAERTGLPCRPLKEAAALPRGTAVIYLGWLCAGGIKGLKGARRRFRTAAVCAVGMAAEVEEAKLRRDNRLEGVPLFYLRGGYAPEKLTGFYRAMMAPMARLVSRAPAETEADRAMRDAFRDGGDGVSPERLAPVLAWLDWDEEEGVPMAHRANKRPPGRIKSSIVARLNTRLFFRLLGIYFTMDLLLLFLFCGGLFVWSEQQAAQISTLVEERGVPSAEATEWMTAGDYTVTAGTPEADGLRLPGWLPSPEETRGGVRYFNPGTVDLLLLVTFSSGDATSYTLQMPGDEPYAIRLDLTQPAAIFVFAARVLFICQLASLVTNLFKNAGSIKKVLRPIQELAATAAKLNQVERMSPEELKALAGKLDEINATHLDRRIDLPGTQKELKTLAQAINAMLDRINEAYRSQMRFVSDASHELRTPIAVIQGYANLLNRWGKDDPATRQEAIDAIRQEADSMKELVEQLLFLARGDNDSMHIEMETFDLTEVAAEVLKETGMIDQTHTFSARWEGAVPVCADVGLTKQALRILVDNSIKYTPAGGHITLSAALRDGMARLSVQDEGQGIDAGSLPHVFDRFYRTDQSRARQTGGTGLGLAIAKWIVDRHGGWFEVRSWPGVGTRMTIVLPVAELDAGGADEDAEQTRPA